MLNVSIPVVALVLAGAHNRLIDQRREVDTPPGGVRMASPSERSDEESGRKKHIYVVDDEWEIRELLRDALISTGYEVSTFGNGYDALKQMHAEYILSDGERVPSLVLLDLMMPVMDGLHLFAAMQLNPKFRVIPVVVVTAAPNADQRPWVLTLTKPLDLDQLTRVVQAHAR